MLISQFNAVPQNVVVKGNVFAQRTATAGLNWSDLKLRGIDGENRQWRLDGTYGDVLWYDPTLVGEIFVGQGKAVRDITLRLPSGKHRREVD